MNIEIMNMKKPKWPIICDGAPESNHATCVKNHRI